MIRGFDMAFRTKKEKNAYKIGISKGLNIANKRKRTARKRRFR